MGGDDFCNYEIEHPKYYEEYDEVNNKRDEWLDPSLDFDVNSLEPIPQDLLKSFNSYEELIKDMFGGDEMIDDTLYLSTKTKYHESMCKELTMIYDAKNKDYNDSFAKARKEVPNYTLGKLYDKFERYKQLTRSEAQVKSETIEDTLMDLANYAIMELLEIQIEREDKR